jgi:hypothetical protein
MVALAEARRVAIARNFILTVVREQVWDVLDLEDECVVEWILLSGCALFLYLDLEREIRSLRVQTGRISPAHLRYFKDVY